MEPQITRLDAWTVMGVQARVDYTTQPDFKAIWDESMEYLDRIAPHKTREGYFGVSFEVPGTSDSVVDYIAGMAVAPDCPVADGVTAREVPAATYAVFEFPFDEMHQSIEHALHEWLPASRYERDRTTPVTDFLRFGDGPVQFYLPVRKADTP